MVMTVVAHAATPAGVAAHSAPRSTSGRAAPGWVSWTTSGTPAARRWPAIGAPIRPVPMKPTVSVAINPPW